MLESIVNDELSNVYNWLTAYKLSLNRKKTNYVIFRPRQKKRPFFCLSRKVDIFLVKYQLNFRVIDHYSGIFIPLECKNYVKYLGVHIDD